MGSFGRIGMRALAYYFTTTCCAVVIGICCVLTIHPGDPAIKGKLGAGEEDHRVLTIDAFLDLIRSVSGIGARRIFSRGGQIRGLGTKVPQRGHGMDPGGGRGGQSYEKLTTGCENNA